MSALHKVLVVDDDPVVGKSFNRVLSAKGYQVITAHDAAEALERLRQEEVDLVYTDIRMPGMDGLELAEQVRTRRPWTPVVIVTGYGTAADEQRAHAAGVSAFLHKPLSPEMIEGSAVDALRHTGEPAPLPATVTPTAPTAPTASPQAEPASRGGRARDIALFFAAPFIGLVYAVFLPFVGIGLLVAMGVKELVRAGALRKAGRALKFVGLALTTPFIGLAYAVLLPFVGLAALVWVALRSPREPT
jgi:CheY-like chemotaxis protein